MRGEDAVALFRVTACGDVVGEQAVGVRVAQVVVLLHPETAV